jgi:hypothetical protein
MPFSEKIKTEVKHKAAFRCCRCQAIGIDAHHIIPEKYGGADDIDNAAPLCQNCHCQFGDNQSKRKEIKQMRDWWYKKCEEIYSPLITNDFDLLNKIDTKLDRIQHGQEGISDLKEILRNITNQMIDGISPQTAASGASTIVNAATAIRLGPSTYSNFYCSNCHTYIGLLVGADVCPNCKAKIK